MQVKQKFVLCLVKLIEYKISALSVLSNSCVEPLPRIKIYFFLLSICEDELKKLLHFYQLHHQF